MSEESPYPYTIPPQNQQEFAALPSPAPEYQPLLSQSEERNWAMIAHLSILLNLITGFLGVIAAFVIYLVYKDKSRYVAYQSLQAALFQLIFFAGAGLIIGLTWAFVGITALLVVGICLIPFAILLSGLPIFAVVYGIVGAVETSKGQDFKYWLIGDWVRGTYVD